MTEAEILAQRQLFRADQLMVDLSGDRVWLKGCDCYKQLMTCCPAEAPCDHHGRLTHPAADLTQ